MENNLYLIYNVNKNTGTNPGGEPYNAENVYDFYQDFQKGRFPGDMLTVNNITLAEFCQILVFNIVTKNKRKIILLNKKNIPLFLKNSKKVK